MANRCGPLPEAPLRPSKIQLAGHGHFDMTAEDAGPSGCYPDGLA